MTSEALDYGAQGKAQEKRPRRLVHIARENAGSTGDAHAKALRYDDAHLIDRMYSAGQLWDAPYRAARYVLAIYCGAGLEPRVAASYAPRGWGGAAALDEVEESPAYTAIRALLRGMTSREAWLLHSLCAGQAPGWRLPELQSVLERIAKEKGLE